MEETTLLLHEDNVEGVVDYRGRRVRRSECGGWRSAAFIIGVEIAERFAYFGISSNLISYLTGPLGQSTVSAAENVNAWSGAASMLPLLGAFVADSYLGRYRTIVFASLLYVLGLGLLTMSAILQGSPHCLPRANSISCNTANTTITTATNTNTSHLQISFLFFSLYIVAMAQGAHKPCVQAFGADQFDGTHPEESKSRSSFFNWWYCGVCIGTTIALLILNYIQDNLNWALGFGIPCVSMALALIIFLLGTRTYRFSSDENKRNQFLRIAQVLVAAARNWRTRSPPSSTVLERGSNAHVGALQFNFLDKASCNASNNIEGTRKLSWKVCSISQIEETKVILRLIPIWFTCLVYAMVLAQSTTFFIKQGSTMDRSISTSNFQVPAASLKTFTSISTVLFIPIYQHVLVPISRVITKKPSGITMLQRIGFGMLLSLLCMLVAALVEEKRLQVALDFGLIDTPGVTIPMSVWWLVPQYVLIGIANVFTIVGLQEFFYDQAPDGLKSLGVALYLSIFGVGDFLSSFLISIIQKATSIGIDGRDSWFSDNLNRAHLDYFYWLLAILSMVALSAYLYFAISYVYNREIHRDDDRGDLA